MKVFFHIVSTVIIQIFYLGIAYADTVDVWKTKINDNIIIHSNQMEIESGKPMVININNYSDHDTLKIRYFTDTRRDTELWELIFKDINGIAVFSLSNEIDSTVRCYPMPCKSFYFRKSEIHIVIKELKYKMKIYNLNEFVAYINHSYYSINMQYQNKPILRIVTK